MNARRSVWLAWFGAACAVPPYQAGFAKLPLGLPNDAFARVGDVVRADFPQLALSDPVAFRLQSAWCPYNVRGAAAKRRLTLWREGDDLRAVVELRYLRSTTFGGPEWSSVQADPAWERSILDRVVLALRVGG